MCTITALAWISSLIPETGQSCARSVVGSIGLPEDSLSTHAAHAHSPNLHPPPPQWPVKHEVLFEFDGWGVGDGSNPALDAVVQWLQEVAGDTRI